MAHIEPDPSNEIVSVPIAADNGAQIRDANRPPNSPSPAISPGPGIKVRNDGMKFTEILLVNAELIPSRSI